MIPRARPDISFRLLLAGLVDCCLPINPADAQQAAEDAFGPETLACLSVRSGFDLLLTALALPAGSEVLVSALTIPTMVELIAAHGLVAVPLDLDPGSLALSADAVAAAITPRTRAVLVAHLFGSRMPLDAIAAQCAAHGLHLIEDCAQAYCADGYTGHAGALASLFSFGPIKTATALGGGLIRGRDAALLAACRARQAKYPRQARSGYLRRLLIFLLLRLLAHPWPLGLLAGLMAWRGRDLDGLLSRLVRSFPGPDLLTRLRQQPCAPLLRMLARRMHHPDRGAIARRCAEAQRLNAALQSKGLLSARPGYAAAHHTHWVLPIRAKDPAALTAALRAAGFDATRSASSLYALPPPPGRAAATCAEHLNAHLVYLPLYPPLNAHMLSRLVALCDDDQFSRLPHSPQKV